MNKNRHLSLKSSILSSLLLLAPLSFLSGQTILFQDDFSTSESSGEPSQAIWGSAVRNSGSGKSMLVTSENSEQYFGEANNGYLHHRHHPDQTGSLFIEANDQFTNPAEVITVSFDFYMPSTTSWGAENEFNDPRFRLGLSGAFAANATRVSNQIHFDSRIDGISGAGDLYSKDTKHSVFFVYNNSTESVSYGSGNQVASSRYDLWIDGVLAMQGAGADSSLVPVGEPLTTIGIGSFAGGSEMFFDNLVVYEGAHVIPEPSTYALGGGFLALSFAWLGRRRKNKIC